MADLIRFPKVAPGVEEAMVGAWRKGVGETVARGEPLVELITDKATFDLEADAEGVLLCVAAPEKSTVPVGYVLAAVGEAGEVPPDLEAENRRVMERLAAQSEAVEWKPPGQSGGSGFAPKAPGEAVKATPGARRLARSEGADLAEVAEAKGGGVVREEDVRAYLEGKK